jgi:lipid-binding SYLF domain-containing protein
MAGCNSEKSVRENDGKAKKKELRKMKTIAVLFTVVMTVLAISFANPAIADKYTKTLAIFNRSPIVQPLLSTAYGYAVFPTIGKGGIGIGGAYGKGQVYQGGKVTGEASLAKVTIGFQLGGQAFSELILFQDKRAYDEFTSGSFEFDVAASAVVITAGAQAKAGTEGASAGASAGPATGTQAKTWYYKGMAVFVHTKGGLMYEAAIGGQKFSFKAK